MLKKILLGFIGLFVLCLAAIVAIPFIFKDEINAKIKEQINKEILADVEYTSYDLSIIRSFPDLFFTLNDLSVVGRGEFEGDTLADVKQVGIGLELMKFIRGEELLINSVYLDHPQIIAYQLISAEGDTLANYDILPTTEDEVSQSDLIDITADKIEIIEANIYYKDFISGTEIMAKRLNLNASIEYIQDVADFVTEANIDMLSFSDSKNVFSATNLTIEASSEYGGELSELKTNTQIEALSYSDETMRYFDEVKLDAKIDLSADLEKDSFAVRDNEIALNALRMYADGFVMLLDDETTRMDLSFSADKSNFKELLSLVPPAYLKDYEEIEANGDFTLNGKVKGDLSPTSYPPFDLNLSIENGSLHYPDLPSSIEQIYLQAKIKNTSSQLEQMSIAIPKANFVVADEAVEMVLYAEQVLGDPLVDLKLKGDLNLAKVPQYYPLEGVKSIAGQLHADLVFKGLLSDVENEQFQRVEFAGDMKIQNLKYDADDLSMPLQVDNVTLDFTPQYANLVATQAIIGKSDFNINGRIENFINYVLADGTAKGNVSIKSKSINLDELMGEEDTENEEASTATKVPANLDLIASLQANEVFYDGLEMKQVDGGVEIRDEVLVLNKLSANMLGGSAKINGSYDTKNTDKPILKFAYDINKFDIKQTFEQFNTVRAIAPLAKYLTGSFSTNMSLSSFLNNDLSLDLSALSGLGEVRIPYATFNELPIFQKVSETLKLPAFDKPALNNAWTVLKFEEGKVNVEPFQINMKDMVMDIQGSNGFDQSIDYTMKLKVPSDKFGGAATLANDFLAKQKIPLLNLAVPQSLTFHLNVGGMLNKPNVGIAKVTADQSSQGIKDQIKDNVKEQVDNAKEQAKEQVKEELNKVKEGFFGGAGTSSKDDVKENVQDEIDKAKENLKDKFKGFGK